MSRLRWLRPALLAAALAAGSGAAAGAAAAADPAVAALMRGESHYERGQLAPARASYLEALEASPGHFEALCRLVRVESEMGEAAQGEEQRRLTAQALEHARAAVRAGPDSARARVWLAVALGRQAKLEGPRTQIALARQVKAELDRAIALDPRNGRAYHARALWNRRIAGLTPVERAAVITLLGGVPRGASWANAVRDLQNAIQLEPTYVKHHLELGRTYLMLKRFPDARHELERTIALPPTSSARDRSYQAEARELLGRLARRG